MSNIYETLGNQIIELNKSADELMEEVKSGEVDFDTIRNEWLRTNSKYLMFKAIANDVLKQGFNSDDANEVRNASNIIMNERVYVEKDAMIDYLIDKKSNEFVAG